jgi:hypothetical protein
MNGPALTLAAAMAAGGLVLGLGYFAALRRTADLYCTGRSRLEPALLTLGRIAAIVVFMVLAAKLGALPLLTAFLGFLMARAIALHTMKRVR